MLKLKIVAHSGNTIFDHINEMLELSGTAPIIVHRLLKNSVQADDYVLMTEPALEDLQVSRKDVELGLERYDDLGEIKTYIYFPPPLEPNIPYVSVNFPQVFVATLRSEVAKEYAIVAADPEKGFHFHTRRRLAGMLEY